MKVEDILANLKEELETLIVEVNTRIEKGENTHIKVLGKGDKRTWTLSYKNSIPADHKSIFGQLKKIGIDQLLRTVDENC